MATRARWSSLRWARGVALGLAMVTTVAQDAPAADPVSAARDLQSSDDFRVRVTAALTLGRTHDPAARGLLERALGDTHPAVRIAAATALAALGDPAAIPALRQRLATEQSVGVRSELTSAIGTLASLPAPDSAEQRWRSTRYVVAIGDMHNRSEVHGTHASDVLRAATNTHAKSIPGALVSETSDPVLFEEAAARHVPVFLLDGNLQHLSLARKAAEVTNNARVDYSLRRVPQQQLRGMLSGSATSFGTVSGLRDPGTITLLEDQAIEGAVQSALRGAAQGLGDASR